VCAEGPRDDGQERSIMHLSQVASGSPPSQHSQEGQHAGQESDARSWGRELAGSANTGQ